MEFVGAAVDSVRRTGPELAVNDVARTAGVSKTVLYRYFADKDELVDAVLDQISTEIALPRLLGELAADRVGDEELVRAVVAALVAIIEDEPALYRFAYAQAGRAGRADLVAQTEREVAEALAGVMGERMADVGLDPTPTRTWAYGTVGMVQLAAYWWSTARTVPAEQLIDQLTALAWGGLSGLLPPAPTD